MEPVNKGANPRRVALMTGSGAAEIIRQLDWYLGRFEGYVGISNQMESRFTAEQSSMALVLRRLKARGLLFFDSRTSQKSVDARLARGLPLPFAQHTVFVDNQGTQAAVAARLAELERTARARGFAVGIGLPARRHLRYLGAMAGRLRGPGFGSGPHQHRGTPSIRME